MQLLRAPHRRASDPGTNHGMGVVIGETAGGSGVAFQD
jgi:hypothetical protein